MNTWNAISARLWTTRAVAVAALASAGLWAAAPLAPVSVAVPNLAAPDESAPMSPSAPTLEESAFAASIWRLPPAPPEPETAPETQRVAPPKLILVGIVTEGDGRRLAALYDPDTNELRQLAGGDRIGVYSVDAIEATRVTLSAGGSRHALSLETGR
jgi:hypothetical protein